MKEDECECGGKMVRKKVDFPMYGISLGKFPAYVCPECGEAIFTEEVSNQIDAAAKEKGLWGLESETNVGVVGNALDIRVSKKIADFLGLKKGEKVYMHPEGKNKLIVEIAH